MKRILLFTSQTCPKCASVKKQLAGVDFTEHCVDTLDGYAESAYYDVLSVPTVLIINGEVEARYTGALPDEWNINV